MIYMHSCDVQRQTATGHGISKSLQTVQTGVPCTIIPMDNQSSIDNGFQFGQGYDAYFKSGADIQKGDNLLFNGIGLTVQGVKDYALFPLVSHLQVLCQKTTSA